MYHNSSSKVCSSRRPISIWSEWRLSETDNWLVTATPLYSLHHLGLGSCTIQLAFYWLRAQAHSRGRDHLWCQFDEVKSKPLTHNCSWDRPCYSSAWYCPHQLLRFLPGPAFTCTCSWHSPRLTSPDLITLQYQRRYRYRTTTEQQHDLLREHLLFLK